FRIVHHVGYEVRRIAWIDRHGHAAGAEDREVGVNPLATAGREQRDPLSLSAAERDQSEGDLTDAVADFARGHRDPGAAALDLLRRAVSLLFDARPKHSCERVFSHVALPKRTLHRRTVVRFAKSLSNKGFGP